MRLLQVCNVGNICGGTAACAWTITHAFPRHEHQIVFFSTPTTETIQAFAHCDIHVRRLIDDKTVRELVPDVILLHNTSVDRVDISMNAITVQYHHSAGVRAAATRHIACSSWLTNRIATPAQVLYQPVPVPPRPYPSKTRHLQDEPTIGRICTPTLQKWPRELIPFYHQLSEQFPTVRWEFIGAPEQLRPGLSRACGGRVAFHKAGFAARKHLWRWDALLYHHPTLTESFGRTVAEAMRGGCIPIVDDRGGFCEQIESGRTGFLCGSVNDFKEAIATIVSLPQRRQISLDAIAASSQFSLEAFYRQFRSLLLEIATRSVA